MKTIYVTLLCAVVLAGFANCAKKDDEKKATNEMPAGCYALQTNPNMTMGSQNRQACNFNYSAAPGSGFSNYGGGTGYNAYNPSYQAWGGGYQQNYGMGCTSGAQVYSPTKGLGCLDANYLQSWGMPAVYTIDGANTRFTLAPQMPQQQQYGGYGYNSGYNSGYNTMSQLNSSSSVLRVCDSSEPCPSGQRCVSPNPQVNAGYGICYF